MATVGAVTTGSDQGLPFGGASGAVLTKNSATSYDASWATPSASGAFFSWSAGRSYFAPPLMNQPGPVSAAINGWMYFFPVRIPNACTVSSLSLFMSQAGWGGSATYLAMYTDVPSATSGGPGVRLAGGTTTSPNTVYAPVTVSMGNYVFSAATNIWVHMGAAASLPLLHHSSPVVSLAVGGTSTFSTPNSNNTANARYVSASASSTTADVSGSSTTPSWINQPVLMFNLV